MFLKICNNVRAGDNVKAARGIGESGVRPSPDVVLGLCCCGVSFFTFYVSSGIMYMATVIHGVIVLFGITSRMVIMVIG